MQCISWALLQNTSVNNSRSSDIQTTTTSCKRDPNTEERHYNGKLVHESPPVPPDGGYGWVVVAASFVCNFVIDGISFSVGILNTEFLRIFGESNSKTAWIGSLLTGYGFVGKHSAISYSRLTAGFEDISRIILKLYSTLNM